MKGATVGVLDAELEDLEVALELTDADVDGTVVVDNVDDDEEDDDGGVEEVLELLLLTTELVVDELEAMLDAESVVELPAVVEL